MDPSSPAPSTPAPSAAAPGDLALGQTAHIGDYAVRVTGVAPNANDLIAQASEYNEPPTGQFVVVEVSVTYNGSSEVDVGTDVYPSFFGSDNIEYHSSGDGMPPKSAYQLEPLRPGGGAQFQAAFDVPPPVISGGAVRVQDLAHPGLDEPKVYGAPTGPPRRAALAPRRPPEASRRKVSKGAAEVPLLVSAARVADLQGVTSVGPSVGLTPGGRRAERSADSPPQSDWPVTPERTVLENARPSRSLGQQP